MIEPILSITTAHPYYFSNEQLSPRLMNLYYQNFHPSHPVLVPRHLISAYPIPDYLQACVASIGSRYDQWSNETYLLSDAKALIPQGEQTVHVVQAFLILAIGLHACEQQDEAMAALSMAIDVAISIGLNSQAFLKTSCAQDLFLMESARRTWWELYIVDSMMAALHQQSDYRTKNVHCDMELPCEEAEYASGCLLSHTMRSLQHLRNRAFVNDEEIFSSFAYRIEAAELLGRVLQLVHSDLESVNELTAVDTLLGGWLHLVPPEKLKMINHNGEVDTMIFQACMIIHGATVNLHLPRSSLMRASPASKEKFCVQSLPLRPIVTTVHDHDIKASEAANAIAWIASLPTNVCRHTPFFICTLVMAVVVQLGVCNDRSCHCFQARRDRIVHALGLLRTLSQPWPVASSAIQRIKTVAATTIFAPTAVAVTSGTADTCHAEDQFNQIFGL